MVFADPLTLPQALVWEKAEHEARPLRIKLRQELKDKKGYETVEITEIHNIYLPAILACVEKWELKDLPEIMTIKSYPASPRKYSMPLTGWLINSISDIYEGEEEKADPNA